MNRLAQVDRYWHTLKHLKPVQFYGRLCFRLRRPRLDRSPAPALRPASGAWQPPARRAATMSGARAFSFLNEAGTLTREDWEETTRSKLWLYNLHYFDDLNAVDAPARDAWHVAHMVDPRSVVPESIMPPYAFLLDRDLHASDIAAHLETLRTVGVPYTDEMVAQARADLVAQASNEADHEGLLARYPKAAVRDFDGQPGRLTEMDALVAYLQILGRMVDFTAIRTEDLVQ